MSTSYEGWAIVEVKGFRRLVGRVVEATQFGVIGANVGVPVGDNLGELRWQFYPGDSLFGMRPITEEEARREVAPARPYAPALPAKPVALVTPADEEQDAEDDLHDLLEEETRKLLDAAGQIDPTPGERVEAVLTRVPALREVIRQIDELRGDEVPPSDDDIPY